MSIDQQYYEIKISTIISALEQKEETIFLKLKNSNIYPGGGGQPGLARRRRGAYHPARAQAHRRCGGRSRRAVLLGCRRLSGSRVKGKGTSRIAARTQTTCTKPFVRKSRNPGGMVFQKEVSLDFAPLREALSGVAR